MLYLIFGRKDWQRRDSDESLWTSWMPGVDSKVTVFFGYVENLWSDKWKKKKTITTCGLIGHPLWLDVAFAKVAFGSSELSLRINFSCLYAPHHWNKWRYFYGIMTLPAFKKYKGLLILTWLFSFEVKIMTAVFRGFFYLFVVTFLFLFTFSFQLSFTCSKLTIETLEQGVRYVQKTASFWCIYW